MRSVLYKYLWWCCLVSPSCACPHLGYHPGPPGVGEEFKKLIIVYLEFYCQETVRSQNSGLTIKLKQKSPEYTLLSEKYFCCLQEPWTQCNSLEKPYFFSNVFFSPLQATLSSASSEILIYLINFVRLTALISETDRYKNV